MGLKTNKCCCCESGVCDACCDKYFGTDDWPAVIYADLEVTFGGAQTWLGIPLYRSFVDLGPNPCVPGCFVSGVNYRSRSILGIDNGDDTDETCCFIITVGIQCADGQGADYDPSVECTAQVTVSWIVGDTVSVGQFVASADFTCDPAGEVDFATTFGPACFAGAGYQAYTVSFSTSQTSPNWELCPYLCCLSGAVKYATISSTCAALDGQVVELELIGEEMWRGYIDDVDGCRCISVQYELPSYVLTRFGTCSARVELFGYGDTNLDGTLEITDTTGNECGPHTFNFGTTWGKGECCDAGDTLSITVSG